MLRAFFIICPLLLLFNFPVNANSAEMISSLKKCPTGFKKSSGHWLGMPNFKLYMCSSGSKENSHNDVFSIVNYFEKSGNRASKDVCPQGYVSISSGNLCVDNQCYSACTNANLKTIENHSDSALRMLFYDKKCPTNMKTIYVVFKKNKSNPTYSFCQLNPSKFTSSNNKINKITNKTIDVEIKCTEIGFKKGTEKYGECVLKLLQLK